MPKHVTGVARTGDERTVRNLWDSDVACLERIFCFDSKFTLGGTAGKEVSEHPLLNAAINYSLSR